MDHTSNKRRQFLKNTALGALALGISPTISTAKPTKEERQDLVDCNPTTLDYYGTGPFYTENPPLLSDAQLASETEPGTRMIISGRVFNLDCMKAIPDAIIDIWHANDAGDYDNSGYKLRGVVKSNSEGYYLFETIKPGKYLNGSTFRPSHIHFKITPPGFETLTTQLYFEGDTDIPGDAAASITSGQFDASARIIPLTTNADNQLEGTWDIVVNGDGITVGTNDLHLDKGIIYQVFPNPAISEVNIHYGVFLDAQTRLSVYNLQGQLVASLQEEQLRAEKYHAVWRPEAQLPNGFYFIALHINDLQVHYLKVNLTR